MPNQQLALALAKDVLERLNAGKLHPARGTYLKANKLNYWSTLPYDNVQTSIDAIEEECTACAAGSLFLSYIRHRNSITGRELIGNSTDNLSDNQGDSQRSPLIYQTLVGVFGSSQLAMIEAAFETHPGPLTPYDLRTNNGAETNLDVAVAFGKQYTTLPLAAFDSKSDRGARCLRAIMQNIVDNDGIFKPELVTAQVSDRVSTEI